MGRYFIAILPDDNSHNKLTSLQNQLLSLDSSIYKTSLPIHITLKETFSTDTIEELEKKLKELASRFSPFSLRIDSFDVFNNRCIVLKTSNPPTLQKLHEEAIELANIYRNDELRGGLLKACKNEVQKEYLFRYNNIFVKEYYSPHITLVYLGNKKIAGSVKKFLFEKNININMKCFGISIIDKKDNKPRASYEFLKTRGFE